MDHHHALPLEGYRVAFERPNTVRIDPVDAEVDDAAWGLMPAAEVQRRLEAAGDFAIVVLRATIRSQDEIPGLILEVNSEGQRNLVLGRSYLVPAKDPAPPGLLRFRMPDPLGAGEHTLQWSYAWDPPAAGSSGAPGKGGVTLVPPRLLGACVAGAAGSLRRAPDRIDLGAPGALADLDPEAAVACARTVRIPAGFRSLHLEGPPRGKAGVRIDGVDLVPTGDAPFLARLPPGFSGDAELTIVFRGPAVPVRLLRLLP